MINPVVYIPLELKARDLDPRLLLAIELVKRNVNVVIGQQWSLSKNIFNVPKGLFLFKTVNEIQATQMVDAINAGHIVTATDEEVLACACEECFQSGLCQTAAKNVHIFFANNSNHANTVKDQFKEMRNKTVITGNPRIELSRRWGEIIYKDEIKKIEDEIGNYFLFNTNYGWINSIWQKTEDPKEIAIRTGHLLLDDKQSLKEYDEEIQWEKSNMIELEKTISWLIDLDTPIQTVIRPHPAEDSTYWYNKYKHKKNVYIIENSSPTPWILAAKALIHTTCTTGFEATLLGTPSLSITPKPNSKNHSYILSNLVNPTVNNASEAKEIINNFIFNKNGPMLDKINYNEILKKFFPDLDKNSPVKNITEIIVNNINKNINIEVKNFKWSLKKNTVWNSVNRRKEWIDKFSLSTDEIASKVQIIGDMLGIKKEIKLQKLDDSLFNIWTN